MENTSVLSPLGRYIDVTMWRQGCRRYCEEVLLLDEVDDGLVQFCVVFSHDAVAVVTLLMLARVAPASTLTQN